MGIWIRTCWYSDHIWNSGALLLKDHDQNTRQHVLHSGHELNNRMPVIQIPPFFSKFLQVVKVLEESCCGCNANSKSCHDQESFSRGWTIFWRIELGSSIGIGPWYNTNSWFFGRWRVGLLYETCFRFLRVAKAGIEMLKSQSHRSQVWYPSRLW